MSAPSSPEPLLVVGFSDQRACARSVSGGKGASLARLSQARFTVPPGTVVTTGSYQRFLDESGLAPTISALLGSADLRAIDAATKVSQRITAMIEGCAIPVAIAEAILAAYAATCGGGLVAVRSSGTAEDTAEASFAGLHETYLDVLGEQAVLDNVRRCWASMWLTRAIMYRNDRGIDHLGARIAVVLQRMVASEVAGVSFSANPVSSRTDEWVINASWGLGESVVSGVVDPDEFVIDAASRKVRRSRVGSKECQIVRARSGRGTETVPVAEAQRRQLSLTDAQVGAVAELTARVTAHYGDLPQDIEWAIADSTVYLLQSRPVVAGHFAWDECIDAWQVVPHDPERLWTHKWAEELWSGAITPLFYSIRAHELDRRDRRLHAAVGFHELNKLQIWKYRRGTMYYSVDALTLRYQYMLPRRYRAAALELVPQNVREQALRVPMSLWRFVRCLIGMHTRLPEAGLRRWPAAIRETMLARQGEADGVPNEVLAKYGESELKRELDRLLQLADDFMLFTGTGVFFWWPWLLAGLNYVMENWVTGDREQIRQDLLGGLPQRTLTAQEMLELWELGEMLRTSPTLCDAFLSAGPGGFPASVIDHPQSGCFARKYRDFLARHGHRGHADRDFYYARRSEDATLDYIALSLLVKQTAKNDPEVLEREAQLRYEKARDRVLADAARGPLGFVRKPIVDALLRRIGEFLVIRDDWRHWYDRVTFSKKRVLLELGRRAAADGRLHSEEDMYFLSHHELLAQLDADAPSPLLRAKIEGRRSVFNAYLEMREPVPVYLKGSDPIELDERAVQAGARAWKGAGTSRGQVVGRARVVSRQADIGRLQPGDILITNSTDPGWAPAFSIIAGLVLETGGMLAHGSCLSREYGLPAVQLRDAMRLIPDGHLVSVDGTGGIVSLVEEPAVPVTMATPEVTQAA